MLRVWPIVCQFGVGALLCAIGIWCGFRGGYLNLKIPEDRSELILISPEDAATAHFTEGQQVVVEKIM